MQSAPGICPSPGGQLSFGSICIIERAGDGTIQSHRSGFLPVSLAFIMFSVDLELVIADFKRIAVLPKDFVIGARSQVMLLPVIAFVSCVGKTLRR